MTDSKVEQVTTVEFIRDWMMTSHHEVSSWEREFAAAIDARSALASLSQPPVLDEREVIERAAKVAECAFDDRPRSRVGHHSQMDWEDGYREGTRAAAAAIRNLGGPDDVA